MSSPDQHTAYIVETGGGFDEAVRFHLSSRVWPYWSQDHITTALPALRRAAKHIRAGRIDGRVRWTFPGDGTTELVRAGDLWRGLNLWGIEEAR